jgi:transposase InsO family protein
MTLACDILGMARSSYYYQAVETPEEAKLKGAIRETAAEWPTYGYRRLTEQLKRNGWAVNHKRGQRLMRLMDIQGKNERKKKRTTDSQHGFPGYPNLVLDMESVRLDQVWVRDITYIRLHRGFVYLAVIMDVFTRGIGGWHLGRGLDHSLTLTALQRALTKHPTPRVHHSDQGIQCAATAYT